MYTYYSLYSLSDKLGVCAINQDMTYSVIYACNPLIYQFINEIVDT